MRYEPTPEQQAVLDAKEDILVIGRPGSGKTTIALEKARQFVGGQEATPLAVDQRVLFLSFSNAAVQRIQSEARISLRRDVRRRLNITTFHAFCYDFLRSHGRLAGLRVPFRVHPPENVDLLTSFIIGDDRDLAEKLLGLEVAEGLVCFDRFAPLTCGVLKRVSSLRDAYASAYPLIIADEYQDTTDDQHQLVQILRSPGQLICLGDPEQRIYDWDDRPGSRADRLESLQRDGLIRHIELRSNHRSGGIDILDVADAVLRGIGRIPRPASVRVRMYGNHQQLEAALKQEILDLESCVRKVRGDGRVTLAIMAYRNSFVDTLSRLLKNAGGGFEHPFRHRLLLRPEAIAFAWGAVAEALAAPSLELRAAALLRGAAKLHRVKGGRTSLSKAAQLETWAQETEIGKLSGRAAGVRTLYGNLRALEEWSGDPAEDIRRVCGAIAGIPGGHLDPITRVLELRPMVDPTSDVCHRLDASQREHRGYARARQQIEACLLAERLDTIGEASQARILMTIHKCKGKEFDGVIIVNGRYGDSLIIPHDARPALSRSRRLLHVGLTRAKCGARFLTPHGVECEIWPRFR